MATTSSVESQFDQDIREAEKASLATKCNKEFPYKVNNFPLYSESEKIKMFEYIYVDFLSRLDEINDLKDKLNQVQTEILQKDKCINDLLQNKLDLDAHKEAYKMLVVEKSQIQKKANHFEKICRSWCISSLKNEDCLNKQIPNQVQAVLGDDFNLKTYLNETDSSPVPIVPDILPHTFSYTVGDKIVITNAFVKAKCQKDNASDKSIHGICE